MPHFITKDLSDFTLPKTFNQIEFLFKATNIYESLYFVKYMEKSFFIQKFDRESDIVIKIDKLSKIPDIKVLQEALLAFAKLGNASIISENIITQKKSRCSSSKYLKDIKFFIEEFDYSKDICIEIGFGSGRHILYQAKKEPNKQFIAIEIHAPSIRQLEKQCELQQIDNIFILN